MKKHNISGFTFIEVMVTLTIMGILAALTVPMIELNLQRRKEQELRHALMQIREGLDAYKRASDLGLIPVRIGESGFPRRLSDLTEGVTNIKSPQKHKIYFLRRLPRDPMNRNRSLSAEETWGKRSYRSPPDDPREGEDIFDIFSLSTAIGLNGIPYRDW